MHLISRFRLLLICFVALTVSLPMAWISLGKLVLFVTSLAFLVACLTKKTDDQQLNELWSTRNLLFAIAVFALSLGWTKAPADIAVLAFVKHSKIIEIAMLVSLIRTRRDAMLAMSVFLWGQAFFIVSSWTMVWGYRVPWATSELIPVYKHVVYSTYLDQTLIFAASAAVFWHLRSYWQRLQSLCVVFAIAAVVNIVFFQEGKTGYVAALTVVTLAMVWEVPRKWRLIALIAGPVVLGLAGYIGSDKVHQRVAQGASESQNYDAKGDNSSSTGFRLHAWHRSIQAIADSPLYGHGVGSWTTTVKRIEGPKADEIFGPNLSSNPHQEYLMWGVELGVGGLILFLLLLTSLVRDAQTFAPPVMQAMISVIAVMAIACLFNSSLYDALIGDYFCVTLGLLMALGLRSKCTEAQSISMAATQHPR